MKNSPLFKQSTSKRFKNYRHTRVTRTATRNSVLSLITDYIEKNKPNQSFKTNSLTDDGVYFQIFGMCILTIAVVLTFQGFINSDSLATSAEQEKDQKVRLLTNFQYQPYDDTKQSRLQDFTTSVAPETQDSKPTEMLILPKNESSVPQTYEVKEGDSIYSIAADYDLESQDIIAKNNLTPPFEIKVGDTITLR